MSIMDIYLKSPKSADGQPLLVSTDAADISFYHPSNFMYSDGATTAHTITVTWTESATRGFAYTLKGNFSLSNSTPFAPDDPRYANFVVIGGTVTEIDWNLLNLNQSSPDMLGPTEVAKSIPIYAIKSFSLDAVKVFLSFLTPSTSDDAALFQSIFAGNDVINGGNGYEKLFTYGGDDTIYPGPGNNTVNGGPGVNIVGYQDVRSSVTATALADGSVALSSPFIGKQILSNVQYVVFSDGPVSVQELTGGGTSPIQPVQNTAGNEIYRLYSAAFDRHPDKAGFTYWEMQYFVNHDPMLDISSQFISSSEFSSLYGSNSSNATFVAALYHNVLHRAADDAGSKFWNIALDTHQVSRAQALLEFSNSPENINLTAPFIDNGYVFT